jgi:hypothetical protein
MLVGFGEFVGIMPLTLVPRLIGTWLSGDRS